MTPRIPSYSPASGNVSSANRSQSGEPRPSVPGYRAWRFPAASNGPVFPGTHPVYYLPVAGVHRSWKETVRHMRGGSS